MFNYVKLIECGRVVDLYLLARYCYRVGEELISDSEYAMIDDFVKENNLCPNVVNRSYDDDPVPVSLLEEFGLEHLIFDPSKYYSRYDSFLEDEKTISIKAIENYIETYDYFMATKDEDKVMSPKVNGVNCKSLYTRESADNEDRLTFKIGKSRGRNGEGFNFTKNLLRIIPSSLDLDLDNLYLYGECVVLSDAIGKIVAPSGTAPTVERMAAMSMLRTNYRDEDYKYLKYKIFSCQGLSNSLSESLNILKSKGLDVVPHLYIKASEVPSDFNEFCVWMKDKFDYFYNILQEEGYPTDGVVVDVDDLNYTGNVKGQYSDKNVALKFEYWSHKYYIGTVNDIEFKQCGYMCSVTAIIEPTITSDRTNARRVDLYSPAIMMREHILPGSKIYFKRDSEVYNVLVYGDELRKLLGGVNT